MKGDLFKGIKQWEFLNEARHIEKKKHKLPIFYYDNTSVTVVFTASSKKVKDYLPHRDLYLLEFLPGRCLVAFTAFEYRETDIGPYNEFSISILATHGKKTIPGLGVLGQLMRQCFHAYVWHLPVTTEIARYSGVEFYGYPKFIADIVFKNDADSIECALSENRKSILVLRCKKHSTTKHKIMRYKTYSMKDGILLESNVYTDPAEFAETRNTKGIELILGDDHKISNELRSIDLSEKAVMYQYCPVNESILYGPRNLADN